MTTQAARIRVAADNDKKLNTWMDNEADQKVWFPGDATNPPGLYKAGSIQGGVPFRDLMNDKSFNWTRNIRQQLKRIGGVEGAEQDDMMTEIFLDLLFQPGTFWTQFKTEYPPDQRFQFSVKQRVMTQLRDRHARDAYMPTTNLTPTGNEDVKGVAEDSLGVEDELHDQEWDDTQDIFKGFRDYLAEQRHAEYLLPVFDAMSSAQLTQEDRGQDKALAEKLGMSPGKFNNWKANIIEHLKNYTQGSEGVDLLKRGLDRQVHRLKTPDAPPNPGNKERTWHTPDGKEIPVTVKVRGVKTTRVVLPDGTVTVVPTNQLK